MHYSGEDEINFEIDRECEIKQFSTSFGFHNEDESMQDLKVEVIVNPSKNDSK